MIKKTKVSKKDISTWQEYLKNPIDIEDKDQFLKKSDLNNKRFKYDLHGYSLDNANKKVRELIFFCLKRKYKEILLITGKGIHSNTSKKRKTLGVKQELRPRLNWCLSCIHIQ